MSNPQDILVEHIRLLRDSLRNNNVVKAEGLYKSLRLYKNIELKLCRCLTSNNISTMQTYCLTMTMTMTKYFIQPL